MKPIDILFLLFCLMSWYGADRFLLRVSELRVYRRTIHLTIAAWLLLSAVLASSGFLAHFDSIPPRMVLILAPPLLAMFFLGFRKSVREKLKTIPAENLAAFQVYRVGVELFLWWGFIEGFVPRQMTFEGLNWDIFSGVLGLVAAVAMFKMPRHKEVISKVYHGIGLVLLVNIVVIALLSIPSPVRVFMQEPANRFVAEFPYVWLPALLVPLAYWSHFSGLIKK